MGKPAYLHRQKWEDKKFLNLLSHCRSLKRNDHMTLEGLCFYHFGEDGATAQRRMRADLKRIFFVLWNEENILFGPVHWIGEPYYWYVATNPSDQLQILRRYLRQVDGLLRRVIGDDKRQNIPINWSKALGQPVRELLLGHPQIEETAKELMAPLVTCPHCQNQVFQAKYCAQCGVELPNGEKQKDAREVEKKPIIILDPATKRFKQS